VIGSIELAAAVLLVVAGLGKLSTPDAAALTLRSTWRRVPGGATARHMVRAAGALEVGIGAVAISLGDRVSAIALAGCYLAFLAVAARLQLTGRHTTCGCFGATESPVGLAHLVVNTAAVAGAVAAVVRPPGTLGGFLDAAGVAGLVGVGQALLLAYLAFLSMTALPALAAARRRLLETA
jgi:hypothetical protein